MNPHTAINKRFKIVYDELVKRGEIIKYNRQKSKTAFARNIGAGTARVVDCLLQGLEGRNVTINHIEKLHEVYNVSKDYMLQGKGEPFLEKKEPLTPDDKISLILNIPFHPNILFTNVEAFSSNTISVEVLEDSQRFFIPGVDGDLVAFNINGRSMEPTITNGDMVICSPIEQVSDVRDNDVYAVVANSAVWVKRVQREFNKKGDCTHLRLISDNAEEFDPFVVDIKDIRKVLKVKKRLTGLDDF